ncbi:MAG: histidine-type phosphatase [Prevotella sp.]|nr:histidine-type phosphatase [Prevotella sp.]
MRQLIVIIALLYISIGLQAQIARDEIRKDIHYSASNYLAYPGPRQMKLTPAPSGKKPFYLSHYGRHGSRFLIEQNDYDFPYQILAKADSAGKLTPLGKDVLKRVTLLRAEADNLFGELTPLGAKQHQQIAKRMFERFPEVFEGKTNIDAKSTTVNRCILSMEYALLQLISMNPNLRVAHEAAKFDMWYMNYQDKKLNRQKMDSTIKVVFQDFLQKYDKSELLMEKLFNDMAYAKKQVDARELTSALFKLASNLQSTELRRKITLYDLFSDEEVYGYWKINNAWWYINFGGYTLNGSKQPYSQRMLLRRIIQEADSCIQLERPGATLRFGHDTMVLPLTCLLELDGYGLQTDNLESLERKGWLNYKIFPMGANVQFVFYRKDLQDKDVLVKVLLNENEVSLPVRSNTEPYYKWSDVRDYYLRKLDAYQN